MLIPSELVLSFGVFTSVPILVKIAQEMRPDRESAHRRTHVHTDTNRFYNLSHAISYSYGADKNKITRDSA